MSKPHMPSEILSLLDPAAGDIEYATLLVHNIFEYGLDATIGIIAKSSQAFLYRES